MRQIHIERLVLTGFSAADAAQVRAAFVRTLQAEAVQAGAPVDGSASDQRRLTVPGRPGRSATPADIGRDAARALLQSLAGGDAS
ncbi:hypothetical protein [Aquincola sp. J276]|uniref:hypothetical protein n=1 Tax=Aquincola sp. J276 TaxID=2898432 RepID=UPI0021517DC4|nr:hypothetical protein [Aquincola sp. J276]MCR5868335.1 hypothetical protein [Aquincola sp. J276]